MPGPGSFRATVQPLVRGAAMRGATVGEITRALRTEYGRAYRRSDLLADIRSYRDAAQDSAVAGYRDMRRLIARAGVAAFSLALLVPAVVHGGGQDRLIVASSLDAPAAALRLSDLAALELASLPTVEPTRLPTLEPTPGPAPVPALAPSPAPPPPSDAVVPAGVQGVIVTASWYGPGFYENRLPCWQWLQANGLPIQYLPDTWGVAHKTLPCGTMLTLSHGSSVITVPVVDRGPYVAGRELDLSPRVKAALGCTDLCPVLMHVP